MAITLSTGTTVSIAKTYGTASAISAITNASEAVATLAAGHGVTAGDYVEVSSGWTKLDKRVVRVKTVAVNDVTFESVNTTSTSDFPAGSGVGSVRKISAWTQITQVKDLSTSGGDQQYTDVTTLVDRVQRQIPTTSTAMSMTLGVFDDPTLSWYGDVNTASDSSNPFGLLMVFPNGSRLAANAYWSLNKVPAVAKNEALSTRIALTYAAEPVRYAS